MTLTSYQGVKGIYSIGVLKFKKDKQPLFNWAVESFNKNSKFGKDRNPSLSNEVLNSYLTYFLFALEVTSDNEGGFDAVNTYDRAGISVGFIQFARPNVGVYRLLTEINTQLRDEVREAFGNYPVGKIKKDYKDAKSLKARQNRDLIKRVQDAIITENGIKAQIKLAIEDFYDPAFEEFQNYEFENTFQEENRVIDSTELIPSFDQREEVIIDNYVYANALIFDAFVNLGISRAKRRLKKLPPLFFKTEGNFIVFNLKNLNFAEERREKWDALFNKKFIEGNINS